MGSYLDEDEFNRSEIRLSRSAIMVYAMYALIFPFINFLAKYLEIIPLTEEEFYKMKNRNNKLVKDALAEGVILRDDLHIFLP